MDQVDRDRCSAYLRNVGQMDLIAPGASLAVIHRSEPELEHPLQNLGLCADLVHVHCPVVMRTEFELIFEYLHVFSWWKFSQRHGSRESAGNALQKLASHGPGAISFHLSPAV